MTISETPVSETLTVPDVTGEACAEDVLRYELASDLVTMSEGHPTEAEAIRTTRTHIMARHVEDGRRGLAMCGASVGVGCTFMAVNLAVSLAQIGIKTLLIDGDMRAPDVGRMIRPIFMKILD